MTKLKAVSGPLFKPHLLTAVDGGLTIVYLLFIFMFILLFFFFIYKNIPWFLDKKVYANWWGEEKTRRNKFKIAR